MGNRNDENKFSCTIKNNNSKKYKETARNGIFDSYFGENLKRTIISIDKNSKINRFPPDIRLLICHKINHLLDKITEKEVLKIILTDIKFDRNWDSETNINEIQKMIEDEKYRKPIIIYFINLIKLIQYLKSTENIKIGITSRLFPFINIKLIKNIATSLEYYKIEKKPPFIYENYADVCNQRPDLQVGMTRSEFNDVMRKNSNLQKEKRRIPKRVRLPWKCNEGHLWKTTFKSIKNKGSGCKICLGYKEKNYNDYLEICNSRSDLQVGMTLSEFNDAMEKNLASLKIYSPSLFPEIIWKCNEDHSWNTSLSNVIRGSRCSICYYNSISINYEDYIKICNSRSDLQVGMTLSEFNDAMEKNSNLQKDERLTPSQVKLLWICALNDYHVHWSANYNSTSKGSGCPLCGELIKAIGHLIHPIIELYSLRLLVDLNNCNASYETHIVDKRQYHPDLFIERDSNFLINIEQNQNIIHSWKNITFFSIDFTFGLNIDGILNKCKKGYQNEFFYLIIVLIRENSYCNTKTVTNLIKSDDSIYFPENIIVINFNQYLKFLGSQNMQTNLQNYDKQNIQKLPIKSKTFISFEKVIELALKSIKSQKNLIELKQLSMICSNELNKYNKIL